MGRWGSRVAEALSAASDFEGYATRTEPLPEKTPRFPRMEVNALVGRNDVQAVWIATPIDTHFDVAKNILLSGKHVMVEKPLAGTAREAEELARIADTQNVLLGTGYVFLFDPAFDALKTELAHAEIERVHIRWHKYGTFEETLERNLLTHHLAMMLYLFGEPKKTRVIEREAVESACDRMTSEYEYESFTVTSEINRASMVPEHTIEVACKDATWYWSGGTLKKKTGPGPKQLFFKSDEMPLNREVAAFLGAIAGKNTLPTAGSFGVQVLALQEKMDIAGFSQSSIS